MHWIIFSVVGIRKIEILASPLQLLYPAIIMHCYLHVAFVFNELLLQEGNVVALTMHVGDHARRSSCVTGVRPCRTNNYHGDKEKRSRPCPPILSVQKFHAVGMLGPHTGVLYTIKGLA